MANFLLIHDPNVTRRNAAASRAHARVAFLPGLHGELVLSANYAVTWAAAPDAPVSHAVTTTADGLDCILFGDPHDPQGNIVNAEDLRQRHQSDWAGRDLLNGFYGAVFVHPHNGVRAEADVLGMFPIFYWHRDDVVLIGTSPELFRCHDAFQSSLDLHGVAGLLLTSGIVGGRTLWRGVRRLAADHVLFWAPKTAVREVAPPSLADDTASDNVDEAVERVATFHRTFLKTALRNSLSPGLQLSGGLDSRLLAGFATSLELRPHCLTFGRREDLDARCATQVARELNLPQTLYDVQPSEYEGFASSSVEWEQLSGGLYALPMGWNVSRDRPAVTTDRMICGLTLDAVIGGPKNVADTSQVLSFERLRIGGLGFNRAQLASLVADADLAKACDDVREELVQFYVSAGPTDHLREWRTNLAHRHRFAVGACAWRYALFAWPVMPALDRELIQFASTLPFTVVKQRQIQTRMLISRFPRLAELELDRNYLDTAPLIGTSRSLVYDVRRRATKLNRRLRAWLGRDPRFYVRTMEFNSPGWRVIRAMADRARTTATALFRPDALAELIPPSNVTVRHIHDPIVHSTPLKNTLGLVLWMRQHA